MLKKKRWIWNLGSECWLGSILAKGSFRSAGGLSNNEHAKRRQRNGRSICTHLKFIHKVPHDCFDSYFLFLDMRIIIVKECSPYCAKVIFSNKENQPLRLSMQLTSEYDDFLFLLTMKLMIWSFAFLSSITFHHYFFNKCFLKTSYCESGSASM